MSLVGEHCPGTVQLICKGVDLSLLRWRYNGIHDIYSFTTTDLPIAFPLFNSALKFVSIELINVTQTSNDARFAEFTSILILDIAQLEFVTNITCGDPGTIDTVPVNTTLLQQSTPISPTITSITATYYSGQLRTVNISWIKLVWIYVFVYTVDIYKYIGFVLQGSYVCINNEERNQTNTE